MRSGKVRVLSNLAVGADTVGTGKLVDLVSTIAGLGLPVMTTTQRNAIPSPTAGITIFNDTTDYIEYYDGVEWVSITSGGGMPAFTMSFTNADLVAGYLTVTHGLNFRPVITQVFDDNWNKINPDEITLTDDDVTTIKLVSYGTITGTWNVIAFTGSSQGPQGEQGFQGFQGPADGFQGFQGFQGNQGFQGLQGSQGFQGLQGSQGFQGNQGFQGFQGRQGFQGLQGLQGSQGFQGNQGEQGFQGEQGEQGDTGEQGFQGFQGPADGEQGFQGFQGFQGEQGEQGEQGFQGPADGAQGFQGEQGFQGFQGNQGFQGPQGEQGFQGFQGPADGEQGFQGFQGEQGFQGDDGVDGAQGFQGFQGFQGPADGEQGFQGFQGEQGFQGFQGFQGNQGFQGFQGFQGNQGFQGPSDGAQGFQGFQGYQGSSSGSPYIIPTLADFPSAFWVNETEIEEVDDGLLLKNYNGVGGENAAFYFIDYPSGPFELEYGLWTMATNNHSGAGVALGYSDGTNTATVGPFNSGYVGFSGWRWMDAYNDYNSDAPVINPNPINGLSGRFIGKIIDDGTDMFFYVAYDVPNYEQTWELIYTFVKADAFGGWIPDSYGLFSWHLFSQPSKALFFHWKLTML